MSETSITFLDLVPFTSVLDKHIKSPEQLKEVFIKGIKKDILFYTANQSDKCVQMIRWREEAIEQPPFQRRFHDKEEMVVITRGEMLPICHVFQFDKLYKGVLNEIDLFVDLNGFDELIEYQQITYLFETHAEHKMLTAPSDFRNVSLQHIFIRNSDLDKVTNIDKQKPPAKEDKQSQRERAFIEWLNDKDHITVSNMRKDDVWAELQRGDRRLFNAGSKHFFRVQKIITFKSGQRSKQQF